MQQVLHQSFLIEKTLKRMAYDAYYKDHQLCLTTLGLNKIRTKKKRKTIQELLPTTTTDPALLQLQNIWSRALSHLFKAKHTYNTAEIKANSDWSFNSMIGDKDNHNVHGARNYLPGLGSTKLRKLMEKNIDTCHQLLCADPRAYRDIKPFARWQSLVRRYYDGLKAVVVSKKSEMDIAQVAYNKAQDNVTKYKEQHGVTVDESIAPAMTDCTADETASALAFSSFDDKLNYNGKILSKYRIDSLVMSVFNHR